MEVGGFVDAGGDVLAVALVGAVDIKVEEAVCIGEALETEPASPFLSLKCWITPSRRRRRERSSASGGRLDLRGARPGGGKTQSTFALTQLEQGDRLLQRTLRRRQVTQLRELAESRDGRGAVAGAAEGTPFGELSLED